MGADEEGTHGRLKAHLRELIEPKIAEHRDRIVKNTGDGFLTEFASGGLAAAAMSAAAANPPGVRDSVHVRVDSVSVPAL